MEVQYFTENNLPQLEYGRLGAGVSTEKTLFHLAHFSHSASSTKSCSDGSKFWSWTDEEVLPIKNI